MIEGLGIDVVNIDRFADSLERTPQLKSRLFTEREQLLPITSLAARFAAKEALSKAMRTGFREPMSWHGVQLLNQDNGMPYFLFNETLSSWFGERGLVAHVSISDEKEYALAFVILETSAASLVMSEK